MKKIKGKSIWNDKSKDKNDVKSEGKSEDKSKGERNKAGQEHGKQKL